MPRKSDGKMINNRLKWNLDKRNILPQMQTGFRRGCTTTDNLIKIESTIKFGFNKRYSTTAIFLDISKAYYDNAWIEGILFQLAKAKVKGQTLNLLRKFLPSLFFYISKEQC